MKPNKLSEKLIQLVKCKEPVLLVGLPGLGKTDVVESVAKVSNHDVVTFHPVVDDPTNYKGLPCEVEGNAEFLPYAQLRKLVEADSPTIAFFDDLGQASQSVQGALMQLFLSRKVNEHKISDQVTFIAATNSRKDRAGVKGLIKPLLSRFTTIIKVEHDVDDWCKWAAQNGMPPSLISFIRFRPQKLMEFDPNFVDSNGEDMVNQPSPRTVAACGRLVNAGIEDYEILSGCVGESFASEYKGFIKIVRDLGDMPKRIATGRIVDCPSAPDVLYALCGSLAHFAGNGLSNDLSKDYPDGAITQGDKKLLSSSGGYWSNIAQWGKGNLPEEFQILLLKEVEGMYQDRIWNTTEYVEWSSSLYQFMNNE